MGNKRVVRSAALASYDADDFANGFNEAFWVTNDDGVVIGVRFAGVDNLFAAADAAILNDGGGVVSFGMGVEAPAVRTLLGISGGEVPAIISEADGTIVYATGVTAAQVRALIALQDGVAIVQDGTGLVSFGTGVDAQALKTLIEVVEPAIVNEGADVVSFGTDVTLANVRALLQIVEPAVITTAGLLTFGDGVTAAEFRTFIGVSDDVITWNVYAIDSIFVDNIDDDVSEYTRRGVNYFRQVIEVDADTTTDKFFATRDPNTGVLTDELASRGELV